MPGSRPTVRTLAAALGLSRATVSNALRGHPAVKESTRQRVQEAAEKAGYTVHPFAAQVMSQLRRRPSQKELGTIAVLEMSEPGRPAGATAFNADLVAGIRERAASMGFKVSYWMFGEGAELSLTRLDQMLRWRAITGVVLLPTWSEPDFRGLDWTRLSGVYLDYLVRKPELHTVSTDHFRTLFNALERARELGYRRPGFAVVKRANHRIHYRWIGAYLGYMNEHPELTLLPPLQPDSMDRRIFSQWFKKHRPDVVITHWLPAMETMAEAGAVIPDTHGYICLNLQSAPAGCSGFAVQAKELGVRAAERVISQLSQGEKGCPTLASATLVPSRWVEGTTVRRQK